MKAIMYHYVRPYDSNYPYFKNLDLDDFKRQLDFFEKEFGFVRKEKFISSLNTGVIPQGVVLTFDDGLSCHYKHVLPELLKRNLWGIFYIPTQPYLENKFIDVHRIHLLLGKCNAKELFTFLNSLINEGMFDLEKIHDFENFTYSNQKNDNYTLLVKRILNYYISYQYREAVINQLMTKFIPTYNLRDFYLTTDEIKTMHNVGMIIGNHTVNHPVMSRLTIVEQEKQIVDSFNFLENITTESVHKTFCYPYGGFHSFTDDTEKLLEKNNCLYSFNVEQRDICSKDLLLRPQALPRYDCNQFKYGQVKN